MRDFEETSVGFPNDKFKVTFTVEPTRIPTAFKKEVFTYEVYEMSVSAALNILELAETLEGMEG
jgi:hypothetical protein